ncbi:MAG: DegV family protein [Clostridiales bacterium]|nr:DegV family protein [Clostridiales bacterium]
MSKVKIITDSCSDMGKDLREKYDVDYARMTVTWSGVEKYASTDWEEFSAKELYGAMRAGVRITTNQVSVAEFERVFGKYAEEGYDIVYVACSSALSGSYNVGQVVAKNMMEKYPNCKIFCVDPKNSCAGEALVAIEAAKLAAQGLEAEEIARKATELSVKALQFVTTDTLTYLKRAGRVKAAAAFFGNLFGIKPIIISNEKGENEAIKKIKGRKNAMNACVDMLKASIDAGDVPASEQTVYVVNADCVEDSDYLVSKVKEVINPKDIYVNTIGPIIGASVGPGAVAVYAFGNPKTALGE